MYSKPNVSDRAEICVDFSNSVRSFNIELHLNIKQRATIKDIFHLKSMFLFMEEKSDKNGRDIPFKVAFKCHQFRKKTKHA